MDRPDKDPTDALERALAAARAAPPEAGADFLARVLADAEAVQDGFAARPAAARAGTGWRGVFRALGGWPALGGLTAATVTGLWIGVAPPAPLQATVDTVLGDTGLGDTVVLAFEPDLGAELFPDEEG